MVSASESKTSPQPAEVEYWYRFEDVAYAPPVNEYEERIGPSQIVVHLRRYVVIKHTPKGVWLERWETHTGKRRTVNEFNAQKKRFVLKAATKRFACPTIEEAKKSFLARKGRLISIMKARIKSAEEAIELAVTDRYHQVESIRLLDHKVPS